MNTSKPDGPSRLLALSTRGMPAHRAAWGAAMRAELAAIDEPAERRRFARSAGRAAFVRGIGVRVGVGVLAGALIGATTLAASRLQLAAGGAGVVGLTTSVPALLILLSALVSAALMRSFLAGAATGLIAFGVGFLTMIAVLAIEGAVWMDQRGVFVLDGDPPRGSPSETDVIFNLFSTGMWIGHVGTWILAVVAGAAVGAGIGTAASLAEKRDRPPAGRPPGLRSTS